MKLTFCKFSKFRLMAAMETFRYDILIFKEPISRCEMITNEDFRSHFGCHVVK